MENKNLEKKTLRESVLLLWYTIKGNGVKGVVERLEDLEDGQQEILNRIHKLEKRIEYIFGGAVALMVGVEILFKALK